MGRKGDFSTVPTKLYRDQLVTIADLEAFKEELLLSLIRILKEQTGKPAKKWMKSYEVRQLLVISHGTLHALRANGTLPYTKIGNLMYYDREEIDKLLTQRKRQMGKTIPFHP